MVFKRVLCVPLSSVVSVQTRVTSSWASIASWKAGSGSGDGVLGLSVAGDDLLLLVNESAYVRTHAHTRVRVSTKTVRALEWDLSERGRSPSISSKQAGSCQHFVDVLEEESGDNERKAHV